jgi:hypothetical protein
VVEPDYEAEDGGLLLVLIPVSSFFFAGREFNLFLLALGYVAPPPTLS